MINFASGASTIILSRDNDFHRAVTSHYHFFHFGGNEVIKGEDCDRAKRVPRDRDKPPLSGIRALNHRAIRHLRSARDLVKEGPAPRRRRRMLQLTSRVIARAK